MLIEAIEQVSKLKISAKENQHFYYEAVLESIEKKLRTVYKGGSESETGGIVNEKICLTYSEIEEIANKHLKIKSNSKYEGHTEQWVEGFYDFYEELFIGNKI